MVLVDLFCKQTQWNAKAKKSIDGEKRNKKISKRGDKKKEI